SRTTARGPRLPSSTRWTCPATRDTRPSWPGGTWPTPPTPSTLASTSTSTSEPTPSARLLGPLARTGEPCCVVGGTGTSSVRTFQSLARESLCSPPCHVDGPRVWERHPRPRDPRGKERLTSR